MCCKGRLSLVLVKGPDMLVIVGYILLSDVKKIVEIRVGKKKVRKKCAKTLWKDVNKTCVTEILEVGYQL